ncbi:polyisoprenoid-binding protein YceI [Gelidibacter algens]|uniref:Polyisoprenoid-binding protein YceI n=1 Tax=Gelidibacter algens TaxID=49280 RepID=A0A1A7R2X4_9FLAO|nr:YceI family protein [Gelidibacter algens]OBX25117.1 hypothetical protein A9996_11470 [Gelidibacter algens]RAJ20005.1 polyisoprenoid-binding protein YceI [Gelidibacter algens]
MKRTFFKILALIVVINLTSCGDDDDISSNSYKLQEASSKIEWKGYSPVLFHVGSFSVKGEDIEVIDGRLFSGTFTIPIVSIQNFDLPEEVKPELLNHLKSADFFNLAVHPNAKFIITKVEPSTNPAAETNYIITGNFTMLGQTHPISFPALIILEGNNLKLDSVFEIDRTKWGMNYAADPELGEHHILPGVDIKLDILAKK